MSKVEEIKAGIIAALYDGNDLCKSKCVDIVELLIQAVRDEEWKASCARDYCERYPGADHECSRCQAKGTRYCP